MASFKEFSQEQYDKRFRNPKKIQMRTFEPAEPLPHEPGSLSQQFVQDTAKVNERRANRDANTGEVIGYDQASGESLIRQPGNKVVRASVDGYQTPGTQVSLTSSGRASDYERIRREGTSISSTVVSNSGWQAGNSRGSQKLSVTSTKSIADIGLLKDPCTPPDVKRRIMDQGWLAGVYVDSQGNYLTDPLAASEALSQIAKEQEREGDRQKTLPDFLSLDSLGGEATQELVQDEPVLWQHVGSGVCVQSAEGFFTSQRACEVANAAKSYNCVSGVCIEIDDTTGEFQTLADCQDGGCTTNYRCSGGECIPDDTGPYSSLTACLADGCYQGFDCQNGECVPAQGGQYRSLACCQSQCGVINHRMYVHLNTRNEVQPLTGYTVNGNQIGPLSQNNQTQNASVSLGSSNSVVLTEIGDQVAEQLFLVYNARRYLRFTVTEEFTVPRDVNFTPQEQAETYTNTGSIQIIECSFTHVDPLSNALRNFLTDDPNFSLSMLALQETMDRVRYFQDYTAWLDAVFVGTNLGWFFGNGYNNGETTEFEDDHRVVWETPTFSNIQEVPGQTTNGGLQFTRTIVGQQPAPTESYRKSFELRNRLDRGGEPSPTTGAPRWMYYPETWHWGIHHGEDWVGYKMYRIDNDNRSPTWALSWTEIPYPEYDNSQTNNPPGTEPLGSFAPWSEVRDTTPFTNPNIQNGIFS